MSDGDGMLKEGSHQRIIPEKTLGRRGYKRRLTDARTKLTDITIQLDQTAEQLFEQKALTDVELQRAETDRLTGLPNENAQERIMDEFIERMRRHGTGFALLQGDLSGLKYLNDTFNDKRGNDYIAEASRIMIANTRRFVDAVIRPHGDTFLILLDNADTLAVKSFWKKINPQFVKGSPENEVEGGIAIGIGATIATPDILEPSEIYRGKGILEHELADERIANRLLRQANEALLIAKPLHKRGLPGDTRKNTLVIYGEAVS